MENKELAVHETGAVAAVNNSPIAMFQMAATQGMDLDKLDKMLELQEKWEARESKRAYIVAMAAFKADPPTLFKQSKVEFGKTKYNYASLDHVAEEINSALSKYGMFASWTQDQSGDSIKVTCKISHQAGHFEETSLVSKADMSGGKNAIQGLGSAVTYLQRYTLLALTGLAAKGMDTDGNYKDKNGMQRTAPVDSDMPPNLLDTRPEKKETETFDQFCARKELSKAEIVKLENYITESAKALDMEPKVLKGRAVAVGDLDEMLEVVMTGDSEPAKEPAKDNWWDQSKHWSFRKKEELKVLIMFGFGNKNENDAGAEVCKANPDAYNLLRTALPDTKKALVKKYDKLWGDGEFNKLIGK